MKHKKKQSSHHPAVTRYPSPISDKHKKISDEEKIALIADKFYDIMDILGLDLEDSSLAKTPHRVASMYVNEIFAGLDVNHFPDMTFIENTYNNNEKRSNLVFVKAKFTSFCEHHFVPMTGEAYIAYLPQKKLIGLSKISRIVRYFSSRPQVQERLGAQIADSISTLLETPDVAVFLTAQHFCVTVRGIEDGNGTASTSVFLGKFESDPSIKQEFFQAMQQQGQRT